MAIPDTIMISDSELSRQITELHTLLDAGSTLRLFTDDADPDPETAFGDLTEPTGDWYEPVDLAGEWTSPARDEMGIWSTQTEIYTFANAADPDETITGLWVEKDGVLILSVKFATPVTLVAAGATLRRRVVYLQYAGLVLAQLVLAE